MIDDDDPPRRDGWNDLNALVALVRTLFGDALVAADPLAPKLARDISRWLRAAEAFARVLLLTLARTVVLAPTRTAGALAGQAAPAGPPNAGAAPAVRRGGGRGLFALARSARRWRRARARREWTLEEERAWHFFGGKERAAEERARRKAQAAPTAARPGPPASRRPVVAGGAPAARGAGLPTLPGKANLVRRFNALIGVLEAPDAAARRLARRLAAAPALARRILAAAFPKTRWRSGYDDTIGRYAHAAAAAGHDTS